MAKKVPFSYRYPSPCGSACRRWPSPSLQRHLQGVQLFCVQFPYTISETMVCQDRLGTNSFGISETSKGVCVFRTQRSERRGCIEGPAWLSSRCSASIGSLRGRQVRRATKADGALQEKQRRVLVRAASYVCPEPVLAN
jgi:hypothetical protein